MAKEKSIKKIIYNLTKKLNSILSINKKFHIVILKKLKKLKLFESI